MYKIVALKKSELVGSSRKKINASITLMFYCPRWNKLITAALFFNLENHIS